jgi:hypothetical protein
VLTFVPVPRNIARRDIGEALLGKRSKVFEAGRTLRRINFNSPWCAWRLGPVVRFSDMWLLCPVEFGRAARRWPRLEVQLLPGLVQIVHFAPVEVTVRRAPSGPPALYCSSPRGFGPALAFMNREGAKRCFGRFL